MRLAVRLHPSPCRAGSPDPEPFYRGGGRARTTEGGRCLSVFSRSPRGDNYRSGVMKHSHLVYFNQRTYVNTKTVPLGSRHFMVLGRKDRGGYSTPPLTKREPTQERCSYAHRSTTTFFCVKKSTASQLCPCKSPKKLSFQPLNGKNAMGAATPMLIPMLPICAS